MSRPPKLREWADQQLGGRLNELLAHWLAQGMSLEDIAYTLRQQGISVSRESVRRWIADRTAA